MKPVIIGCIRNKNTRKAAVPCDVPQEEVLREPASPPELA